MMAEYEATIKKKVHEYLEKYDEAASLKKQIEGLQSRHTTLGSKLTKMEQELMQHTGNNIRERHIIIDGRIVYIHQKGVKVITEVIQ
jgi:hypothetical protein